MDTWGEKDFGLFWEWAQKYLKRSGQSGSFSTYVPRSKSNRRDLWESSCNTSYKENEELRKDNTRLDNRKDYWEQQYTASDIKRKQLEQSYATAATTFGKALASEIAMDDSKSENISTQCRPSVIREKYVKLTTEDASNIKSLIQLQRDEINKEHRTAYVDQLFCMLYMTTFSEMIGLHKKQLYWLSQPAKAQYYQQSSDLEEREQCHTDEDTFSPYILQSLSKYSKNVCDNVAMDSAIQTILRTSFQMTVDQLPERGRGDNNTLLIRTKLENALSDQSHPKEGWCHDLTEWIRSLCSLAWQMTLQNPPMTLETPRIGEKVDMYNDKIIPQRNMDFSRMYEYVIDYYLEPHLMHGTQILEAGRVKVRLDIITPTLKKINDEYRESQASQSTVTPTSEVNNKDDDNTPGNQSVSRSSPCWTEPPGNQLIIEDDDSDDDSAPGNELVVPDQDRPYPFDAPATESDLHMEDDDDTPENQLVERRQC